MVLGATLVSETVANIRDNKVSTQKQPKIDEKIAPKLFPENCKINWEDSLDSIYNHIRGLNPFPAAWSEMNNGGITTVKIYKVRKEKADHTEIIKTITTSKEEIKIAVKGGYIHIDQLKISGKKKLDSKSLLNGYTFSSNAEML